MSEDVAQPNCLRDAFYRLPLKGALPSHTVILAEKAQPLSTDAGYQDLLLFESDIAQVVALILLFVESPGSLAELGAFSAMQTIAPSLLAVVHDYYYDQISFIKNGPILHLEKKYSDEHVLVIERNHLGIDDSGSLNGLDVDNFSQSLIPPIRIRLHSIPRFSKFEPSHAGHAILLLTGLCQEFGALTFSEIKNYLDHFDSDTSRLRNYIYCATLLGWIRIIKKGNHTFYAALSYDDALDLRFHVGAENRDRLRWRSDIRAYWMANDRPRHRAIGETLLLPTTTP